MRLSLRQWTVALAIVAICLRRDSPHLADTSNASRPGSDYRIPYRLSNDYWLYDWRLQRDRRAGTDPRAGRFRRLGRIREGRRHTAALPQPRGRQPDRFVNAGVNGLFPLAMEGLVRHYGEALHDRKVIVVLNLLWLSSPKADMQSKKAETSTMPCSYRSSSRHSLLPGRSERAVGQPGPAKRRFLRLGQPFAGLLISSRRASPIGRWTKTRTTARTPTGIRWLRSRCRCRRAKLTTPTAARAVRGTSPGRPATPASSHSSG